MGDNLSNALTLKTADDCEMCMYFVIFICNGSKISFKLRNILFKSDHFYVNRKFGDGAEGEIIDTFHLR